jgi:hypothetical protein
MSLWASAAFTPVVGGRRFTPDRGRWTLSALALLAFLLGAVPAHAQTPSTPFLRWKYFHDQRAYPFGTIPPGAMQRARGNYLHQWPPPPAGSVPQLPGSVWSSIDPTQVTTSGTLTPVGRITTVAIQPTESSVIYIGGAQGGVWKTMDGGTTWTALTDTQCSLAMGALAIDPMNPNIVYTGTGEENSSSDSYYDCGVSTDGGATWTQVTQDPGRVS